MSDKTYVYVVMTSWDTHNTDSGPDCVTESAKVAFLAAIKFDLEDFKNALEDEDDNYENARNYTNFALKIIMLTEKQVKENYDELYSEFEEHSDHFRDDDYHMVSIVCTELETNYDKIFFNELDTLVSD